MIRACWNRFRLNLRALRLAASGTWLSGNDIAGSYDTIAETYDRDWLIHLRATTDRLHDLLAAHISDANQILELGSGSGYSTAWLRNRYPGAAIDAVDISPGMIEKARQRLGGEGDGVDFHCGDMLEFLKQKSPKISDLVFSGWAIGYSRPAAVIAETSRTLKPGGLFAVIVNRLDTMPAVFKLFRRTLRRFPDALEKAVWPRFPRSGREIAVVLEKHRFHVEHLEEGSAPIVCPPRNRLDWILGTGVLAGFDSVLPLTSPRPVRDWFAAELDKTETGWEHRYLLFVARKKPSP